jgi:drug/metabolite transporter (DMT)-like permease
MCWTRALQLGDASMLTPISFLQVLVVGLFGWWLFGERVDAWTFAGAGIIFASILYIAHRETRLHQRTVTDPDIASETSQR